MRLFLALVLSVAITCPAFAEDWCKRPGKPGTHDGGVEPCGIIPVSWEKCGTFQGGDVYCYPSQSTQNKPKNKSNKNATALVISVGAAAVFAGVMWYIFKKPKSENIEGHVRLAAF
jgi:hypothetical protein